ncbi:hemolymph lipopolysaccharide-binding protein-like [Periplaneta americana]|uniref:hemolymph lipopolysaccharide-binding protein-like n=1 Tax=Periplaneta americana TaxID=6978 RepID=UPI0037E73731
METPPFRTVIIGILLSGLFALAAASQCSSPTVPSGLKFSIKSQRNSTGHWIAKVKMGHGAGQNVASPWDVDIEHTSTKCEEDESILLMVTITAPPQKPGRDYELVPDVGYYKLHQQVTTWFDARKTCIKEGTHLVVINSETEAKALLNIMAVNNDTKVIFVGFNDIVTEGDYITVSGESLNKTGFVRWAPNEPNPKYTSSEDCGTFRNSGQYNDVPCTVKYAFICEQELK